VKCARIALGQVLAVQGRSGLLPYHAARPDLVSRDHATALGRPSPTRLQVPRCRLTAVRSAVAVCLTEESYALTSRRDEFGDVFGGLPASGGVDAGVVAHECAGVVAEAFGDFVDAVPVVDQGGP
jgi:hypothetical protein